MNIHEALAQLELAIVARRSAEAAYRRSSSRFAQSVPHNIVEARETSKTSLDSALDAVRDTVESEFVIRTASESQT